MSELTRNIYVPNQKNQKTDRIVNVTNKNLTDSKNIQKLQLQLKQTELKEKKINETNKLSNENHQINSNMLNQSLSSDNGIIILHIIKLNIKIHFFPFLDSQDIRHPTRVSAKIQQLLNTLKVKFFLFSLYVCLFI